MGRLEEMKERYDEIVIPAELNERIQQEIEKSRRMQAEKHRVGRRLTFQKVIPGIGAAAAAVCVLFTAALNTSPVFAGEAAKAPVIGGIARILTFRSYETQQNDIAVSVEIPTIEMIAEDTGIMADEINQEILDRCSQYAEDAVRNAEEYRSAFLETGGTPEEWAEHDVKIMVSYEIKQQNNDYLSFAVKGTQNWTSAGSESKYYNLDLNTGKMVTLEDLLGSDYAKTADESIRAQIAQKQEAGETFFTEEEGGFSGISEDTRFYINENNRPVVVFEKYEIAPGASGEPEFEIVAEQSMQASTGYEDNFAVDSRAAKEFAEKIKEAVKDKDLEALADLTAFPVYVGLPGVDVVETREDFIKLGTKAVFTKKLIKSVMMADIDDFQPCMAGFSVSDGGTANVNFTVVNGELAVNGINY